MVAFLALTERVIELEVELVNVSSIVGLTPSSCDVHAPRPMIATKAIASQLKIVLIKLVVIVLVHYYYGDKIAQI